ncbi:MOSC domain-containing protein [Pelagibaculum spongiae]|uniref:Sulfurase n=1 Tax=Pelagibaculum spongiae TaxID=2080658 RepID=A0A2V1GVP7_9GAMM|nr:MOSC domain-containing protein [Pelagibaculum spongiae]PVZ68411.1 sulfurase [Pelagibaculum spongiae]
MNAQARLFNRYLKNLQPGQLEWIGLRPGRKEPMRIVEQATAIEGLGFEGDHRSQKTPGSARQITLISQEYIQLIEQLIQKPIQPEMLRRNLVLSGINLHALRHQKFQIGDAIFEATAQCHPCGRMEKVLGENGVAAMLGHGGLCAKILQSGKIKLSDPVIKLSGE